MMMHGMRSGVLWWRLFNYLWWRLFNYLYHLFVFICHSAGARHPDGAGYFVFYLFFIFCHSAGARYPDGAGDFGKDHQVCAWRKQRLMEATLL